MPSEDAGVKAARLNMRLSTQALDTIREAAQVQQQDVTSFVLGAALDRARAVLAEARVLRLSSHDRTQLDDLLDRDPELMTQLAALLARSRRTATPSADASVQDPS